VKRVDPTSGRVVSEIPVPGLSDYRYLALGAGAVWITDSGTEQLTRIDPRSNRVTATIPLSVSPTGIIVARDSVWISYLSANGSGVIVIDAHTNHVGPRIQLSRAPQTIDVSMAKGDAHVWVSDGAVIKQDNQRNHLIAAFTLPSQDSSLNAAGNRALWFVGDDTISRIDTHGLRSIHFVPHVSVTPLPKAQQVVVTKRAVWVLTNRNDVTGGRPGQLWELDPTTLKRARSPITVGETPVRLFVARDAVWVANYTDASITKVALQSR
jgi:DNA-binding beta-propeller fold protein YncE